MIFLIQLQEEMKSLALLSLLALVSITLSQKGQKGEAGAQGAPGLCTGSCTGGGGVSERTIINAVMHHACMHALQLLQFYKVCINPPFPISMHDNCHSSE